MWQIGDRVVTEDGVHAVVIDLGEKVRVRFNGEGSEGLYDPAALRAAEEVSGNG